MPNQALKSRAYSAFQLSFRFYFFVPILIPDPIPENGRRKVGFYSTLLNANNFDMF